MKYLVLPTLLIGFQLPDLIYWDNAFCNFVLVSWLLWRRTGVCPWQWCLIECIIIFLKNIDASYITFGVNVIYIHLHLIFSMLFLIRACPSDWIEQKQISVRQITILTFRAGAVILWCRRRLRCFDLGSFTVSIVLSSCCTCILLFMTITWFLYV